MLTKRWNMSLHHYCQVILKQSCYSYFIIIKRNEFVVEGNSILVVGSEECGKKLLCKAIAKELVNTLRDVGCDSDFLQFNNYIKTIIRKHGLILAKSVNLQKVSEKTTFWSRAGA